jgi:acyl-coenzyme A thioesterase PaaI-like protein
VQRRYRARVGFSLSYLEGGRGDLVADARVIRRGRRLIIVQIEVYGADDSHVATAQLTYSLTAPPR